METYNKLSKTNQTRVQIALVVGVSIIFNVMKYI